MTIINTYSISYPSKVSNAKVLAVLTQDDAKLYAVYAGIVSLPYDTTGNDYFKAREKAAQWVAHSGQKISYRNALAYFPHMKASEYRS